MFPESIQVSEGQVLKSVKKKKKKNLFKSLMTGLQTTYSNLASNSGHLTSEFLVNLLGGLEQKDIGDER